MSDAPPKECREHVVSFTTFVVSLADATLQQLGVSLEGAEAKEAKDPKPVNLPLARQTIDILEMLEEKTRGNLSEDESRLLTAVLYDLRLRFVKASQGACG